MEAASTIPTSVSGVAKTRILVVDDEESMRSMLTHVLGREGYSVVTASDAEQALKAVAEEPCDVVITDVRMPGAVDGIGLVERLKKEGHDGAVIVMSAYGSRELALESIRKGAYDYVDKPFSADDILLTVAKAIERERLRAENRLLRRALAAAPGSMIGNSPVMQQVYSMIRKVAVSPSTVLVHGESGTGKELVARAIHVESPRKDRPFVAVNCGAIPETLIESELFGHAKGAFTGADRAKKGLVEEAATGTLFLDEIGELPLPMQVKLLRLLQESTIRRVGESKEIKVDVRIVAATARELPVEIKAGRFREDLFYRLAVLEVALPPLRNRREDIPMLVDHFLKRLADRMGVRKEISSAVLQRLIEFEWIGNVRELENTLERAFVLAAGSTIEISDLPEKLRAAPVEASAGDPLMEMLAPVLAGGLSVKKAGDWLEAELIRRALEKTKGNRTQAAEMLELSPRALLYKIRDYKLE